jgi:hypothetical protein
MNKVIVSTYDAGDGTEVEEHIIEVPTAEEILAQNALNMLNTSEAIRHRAVIQGNGGKAVTRLDFG